MTRPGYWVFMVISAGFLAMPLVMALGTSIFWGLAPFMAGALLATRYAIRRNARNLRMSETLWLWRDEMRVERRESDGRILRWQADPMRVRLRLHQDAKIEDYLTLVGGGREIELGAFLSPEERVSLADDLEIALSRALRV